MDVEQVLNTDIENVSNMDVEQETNKNEKKVPTIDGVLRIHLELPATQGTAGVDGDDVNVYLDFQNIEQLFAPLDKSDDKQIEEICYLIKELGK